MTERKRCTAQTEVWSRTCGFFRPVSSFNRGLKEQFHSRKMYDVQKAIDKDVTKEDKPDGRDSIPPELSSD